MGEEVRGGAAGRELAAESPRQAPCAGPRRRTGNPIPGVSVTLAPTVPVSAMFQSSRMLFSHFFFRRQAALLRQRQFASEQCALQKPHGDGEPCSSQCIATLTKRPKPLRLCCNPAPSGFVALPNRDKAGLCLQRQHNFRWL
jgi:hypothetical protein